MDQPLNQFIFITAILVGIAFFLRETLAFIIKVESRSMEPTLKEKDRLAAVRIRNFDKLRRGDIVVFYNEQLLEVMIKRVIGFPGETVEIRPDGTVLINGQKFMEPYRTDRAGVGGTFRVPADSYFMLGDNRAQSSDSRHWDKPYIPRQFIIARAVLRLFPFTKF